MVGGGFGGGGGGFGGVVRGGVAGVVGVVSGEVGGEVGGGVGGEVGGGVGGVGEVGGLLTNGKKVYHIDKSRSEMTAPKRNDRIEKRAA